jgi:hypothetical protein
MFLNFLDSQLANAEQMIAQNRFMSFAIFFAGESKRCQVLRVYSKPSPVVQK